MDKNKQKALEAAGWRFGTAEDFLNGNDMIQPVISHTTMIQGAKESKLLCYDIEYQADRFGPKKPDFDLHGCGFSTVIDGSIACEYYTDRAIIQEIIDSCFNDEIHCIAHNSQSDLVAFLSAGYRIPDHFMIDDTLVIMSLLDENRKSFGLKQLAKSLYKIDMIDYKTASKGGLDTQIFYEYGKRDVQIELKIFCDFYPKLKASPTYKLYREHLMPSIRTFTDISHFGMRWDQKFGKELYLRIIPRIQKLESEIYKKIGKTNLDSPDQLANRLFRDLGYSTEGLEVSRKTGKVSTGAKNLTKLAKTKPICASIITLRSLKKIISTYLTSYAESQQVCGKVSGSFFIHSKTGRTRCTDDNLQNVPTEYDQDNPFLKDIKLRDGFVCPDGWGMCVTDFAALELRVGATVCQEKFFQDVFRGYHCKVCGAKGKSNTILHACPKCGVFESEKTGFWHGQDLHNKTRDEIPQLNGDRHASKTINFAILYLAGGWQLNSQYPAISVEDWEDIKEAFMARLPSVKKYHLTQKKLFEEGKTSWDMFGRRRFCPYPKQPKVFKTEEENKQAKKKYRSECKGGWNEIVNQPIQGPAAVFTQIAQNTFRAEMIKEGLWGNSVRIVNSVHDEIVTIFKHGLEKIASERIQYHMESCERFLDVPLRANPKIVTCWGDAK
jgi:DNA polymerase I-like protein with 3'-5' exonuclease and polymerase domains